MTIDDAMLAEVLLALDLLARGARAAGQSDSDRAAELVTALRRRLASPVPAAPPLPPVLSEKGQPPKKPRNVPLYVARRAGKGFAAGAVFKPQDKQTIRGFGASFGDGKAWDRPWHQLVGDWIEVRLVTPEEFDAATAEA